MSIPIPAGMTRGQVTWRIGHDRAGSNLPGASGTVRFEPTAVAVAYSTATVLPEPVETPVIGGVMTPVDLQVNDPEIWNWRVTPLVGVAWEPFHVDVPGPVDLATAVVVPGVGPVRAVKGEKGDTPTWGDLPGKPETFPPAAHQHAVADVTGLAARLDALEQDTGDRNITSLIPEATAGHWTVRRIGKWVYMNLYDLGLTATAGDYWQKSGFLPAGLRPPAASQYVHFTCAQRTTTGFTPGPFRVDRYGGVTVYGVTGKLAAVTASWITNDAFPTTLPGDPA